MSTYGHVSRRDFLRRLVVGSGVVVGGAGGALLYVNEWEPFHPVIEYITLPLAQLPTALNGLRLAQLSDLHVGPAFEVGYVAQGVALVNEQRPDLVVITGDYVTRFASDAEACAQALAGLCAPLGVWAILGNHDLWTNAALVARHLREAGLRLLINAVAQPVPDSPLWLIGLDDIWSGKPDLAGAIAGLPADGCRILLAHEPDFADTAARPEFGISLQLSGHSHGGQVRLPLVGAPFLPRLGRKYDIGLRRVGEMWLYTNRGLGVVEPPVRFNCPPEVTVFTLTRA